MWRHSLCPGFLVASSLVLGHPALCHPLQVSELMLLVWRRTGSHLWVERVMKEYFFIYIFWVFYNEHVSFSN